MGLPVFLKKSKEASVSAPVESVTRKPDEDAEGEDYGGIETCAEDLLKAIEKKSVSGIAEALTSAFEILDSEPHEEGPHTYSEES